MTDKVNKDNKNPDSAYFVINTIYYVPESTCNIEDFQDSDDETDSVTENNKEYIDYIIANKIDLKNKSTHPYEVCFDKSFYEPFKTVEECCTPAKVDTTKTVCKTDVVSSFLKKLSFNGFDFDDKCNKNIKDYVSVSIGLNRPYSLSNRVNKMLEVALKEKVKNDITHKVFGFYWNFQWKEKACNKKADFKMVQNFYKHLKTRCRKSAENFRKTSENFGLFDERDAPFPPFQHLREYAKNHMETQELVRQWYKRNSRATIYLSLVDSDTVSFNEIYSAYLRILSGGKKPTVMSTGYAFRGVERMYELGAEFDRLSRVAKNECFPGTVYFPEPNTCVLIENGKTVIEESFIKNERSRGRGNESPILLTNVNLNEERGKVTFVFSKDNPLITTVPERFNYTRGNKNVRLESLLSKGCRNGIATYTVEDLENLKKFCQSEFDNLAWWRTINVNGVFRAKNIKNVQNFVEKLYQGNDKKVSLLVEKHKLTEEEAGNVLLAFAMRNQLYENLKNSARSENENYLLQLFEEHGFVEGLNEGIKDIILVLKDMNLLIDPESVFDSLMELNFTEKCRSDEVATAVKALKLNVSDDNDFVKYFMDKLRVTQNELEEELDEMREGFEDNTVVDNIVHQLKRVLVENEEIPESPDEEEAEDYQDLCEYHQNH